MVNIKSWIKEYYNLDGELTPIDGYANANFNLVAEDSKKYIVKVNDDVSEMGLIKAQNDLLLFLSKTREADKFPMLVYSKNGNTVEITKENGVEKIIRVLSWLDGMLIKDVDHTPALFENTGQNLGYLDKSLLKINDPFINQRFSDWDLSNALLTSKDSICITNPADRRLAEYFYLQYEAQVFPVLYSLPRSTIHGDANDYNLLVKDNKISGIIDFGDCVYSQTINELAICLAYLLMGKDDPVKWAEYLVKGYNSIIPVSEIEFDILYYLVAARLTMSVTKSAVSKSRNPANEYLLVSEIPAWDLLWKWVEINPIYFRNAIKNACNIPIVESNTGDKMLAERKRHLSGSLSISYNQPITMNKAAMQYMYAKDGRTYLDCVNNICHVGHSHPGVVKAGQKQMADLNTNTRYLYDTLNEYAEKLTAKFPDPLDTVFFVNSGSEAGDLSQRIARTVTSEKNTIVVDHGYHGNTIAGIEVSPYKHAGKGGSGTAGHIFKLDIPDGYRGIHRYGDPEAGRKYASQIDEIIKEIHSGPQGVAAFYCESIIGCGGQVTLPQGYLKSIYKSIRRAGGLCIVDEVQVGFGRVGEKFWGFELQGVVPDIVVLGKPMGNGHPIAAVVTTKKIADQFNNGMEFFSSFGGNPVSCAIGLEVLKVIEEEGLQENALKTGEYFKNELKSLASRQEFIGDVRGYGLFLGIEFVEDRKLLTPATDKTKWIVEEMKNRGILLSTDGPYNNVIKIKPPMVFSKGNVDLVIKELDSTLVQIRGK